MSSAPTCDTCKHAEPRPDLGQTICLHPEVTTVSTVSRRRVGTDAEAVRYKDRCVDKPRCGPAGSWWEARA